jgi:hypothetical protein
VEIENCLNRRLVPVITLMMDPCLPEIPPAENREDRLFFAVQDNEVSFLFLDSGDPVTPFLHAQQDRDPAPKVGDEFKPRLFRIETPNEPEIAIEMMCRFRELEFVRS